MLKLYKFCQQNQIKNTINQDAAIQHINPRKNSIFVR